MNTRARHLCLAGTLVGMPLALIAVARPARAQVPSPETAPSVEAPAPAADAVAVPAAAPVDTTKAFGTLPEKEFVNPFDPSRDYPQSSILGVYKAGRVDGARRGFVFRTEFRPSYTSGKIAGTNVQVSVAYVLAATVGLGYRFRLERRLGLTVEGALGIGVLGFVTPSGFTRAEGARIGVEPHGAEVQSWESTSNKTALSYAEFHAGPAVTLEYSVTPGFGLFARPLLEWAAGLQVSQRGATAGTITEENGFLHQTTYAASSFGLQVGLMRFSLKHHFQFSLGVRRTTYRFEELPDLDGTGYFLAVGGTT